MFLNKIQEIYIQEIKDKDKDEEYRWKVVYGSKVGYRVDECKKEEVENEPKS